MSESVNWAYSNQAQHLMGYSRDSIFLMFIQLAIGAVTHQ